LTLLKKFKLTPHVNNWCIDRVDTNVQHLTPKQSLVQIVVGLLCLWCKLIHVVFVNWLFECWIV
jgi:hypothetical protein